MLPPRKPKELRGQLRALLDAKLQRQMMVIGAMQAEGERIRTERGKTRTLPVSPPEGTEEVTE